MALSHAAEVAKAAYAPWIAKKDLTDFRTGYDDMLPAALPGTEVEQDQLGGVPGEWVSFPGASDGTVLFLHGGGFFVGTASAYRGIASRIAKSSGARVFSLDYSLAPEHPFPAAYEEATTAYQALLTEHGVDPQHLAIAGDSAGAGLSLSLLIGLRDAGNPLPACFAAMSPFVDHTLSGDTWETLANVDPIINKELSEQSSAMYRGENDPTDFRISPLFGDLHGLPPMLVQAGSSECLLADALRLAENARNAGVDTELQVYYEMVHVFHMFCEQLESGQRAIEALGMFIKQRLASPVHV